MGKKFLLISFILTLMILEGIGIFYFATRYFQTIMPEPSLSPTPITTLPKDILTVKKSNVLHSAHFLLDYKGTLRSKKGNTWVLVADGDEAIFTIGEETKFYTLGENKESVVIGKDEIKEGDPLYIRIRGIGIGEVEKVSQGDLRDLTVVEVDLIRTEE